MVRHILIVCFLFALSACASLNTPENWRGSSYAPQQAVDRSETQQCQKQTVIPQIAKLQRAEDGFFNNNASLLAKGDTIALQVAGDQSFYSRSYVIAANGKIMLPDGMTFNISGRTVAQVQMLLRKWMLQGGLIRNHANNVSVALTELSEAEISISGAVFESGTIFVGSRSAEVRNIATNRKNIGDHNGARTLSQAIRSAGGVRPDADLSQIILIRQGRWISLDLRDMMDGQNYTELQLTSGDHIIVPSLGCFQERLVRPSRLTLPGIRVFMSNLSRPAASNAASAIGKETTSLPYGTRLSQAMVAANCVGGSALNARRQVVLMSRNPINGQSIVISRGVEDLVRDADRDLYDPYMMPGDALACYDSAAMNFRDVLSLIGEVVSPYLLIKNLD